MQITFDTTALATSGSSAANVFVTFAATTSDLVYGSGKTKETINFSGGNINIGGKSCGTSKAYSLKDVAANGLVLNSATSLVGFISYGSATGIEKLAKGTQPAFTSSATPRYSIFEVSYDGTVGGADITNISQFGGSIKLAFLKQDGTVQRDVGNTLDTTAMFRALAKAAGSSKQAVFLDSNGHFVRVLGPNVFPIPPQRTPYPTFNAYLEALYHQFNTATVVTDLTNLAPGQDPGGTGAVGYTSSGAATKVSPNTGYNLDYHFNAVVSPATLPDPLLPHHPNGTYSVKLSGYVNATPQVRTGPGPFPTCKYDGLSITIAADDLAGEKLYMTNFIYQATTAGGAVNVTSSGWDDLNNDFGAASVNGFALQKAAGDFAQGMTCGFPGSPTASTSNPKKTLAELTSYEWWNNPLLAYEPAQPNNPYYSAYGNVVNANSAGMNPNAFSRGGVYGAPYDDRFGLNLIAPDANTHEMRITLLADGDLKP